MPDSKVSILDQQAISARLRRMAYEIYEANYKEQELILIGIDERGGYLSKQLCEHLNGISSLTISLINARLDRETDPKGIGIELSIDSIDELKEKVVLVVDDVLYSGFTMLNVVSILLQAGACSIQTATLIDRGHRKMPVSPDFVGLELATTIHQHVMVAINENTDHIEVFLV